MEEHFTGQVTQKILLFYRESFIIVKEREQDAWILPGGRVNKGESLEDGLKREVFEELGAACQIEKLLSAEILSAEGYEPKLFLYYMGTLSDDQEISINSEIIDCAFVSTKEDLANYDMFENQRAILERVLL